MDLSSLVKSFKAIKSSNRVTKRTGLEYKKLIRYDWIKVWFIKFRESNF